MKLCQLGRLSFCIKPIIAIALVALADAFFYPIHVGSTLGVFALALVAAVAVTHRAARRDRRARWALALAALMSLILFDNPSVLGWGLYWTALAVAVLSPRAGPGLDAAAWFWRLCWLAFVGTIGPALDLLRLQGRLGFPRGAVPRFLAIVAVPVIGGGIFLVLFASANPVISQFLSGVSLPDVDILRAVFWMVCLVGVWSFLRPRFRRARQPMATVPSDRSIPGISVVSVGLSLGVFNALFAVQNGLDIAILWSGAALPKGVTLADYAHRGAYPLIATALLAGVFVLVALRPGSETARRLWLRGLVVLWVVQNVFLVASSILRTIYYVEAYSLTRLRIAALLWMGLVAVGLVLICWRMLLGKSSSWLINANGLAAAMVLLGCSVVDLGAVAAEWNIRHAHEAGGDGSPLDLCYLATLDAASIVAPLSELENRPLAPAFRDRVSWVRSIALANLRDRQARWRDWSWRGKRSFDRGKALYPILLPASANFPGGRCCDASLETPEHDQPASASR